MRWHISNDHNNTPIIKNSDGRIICIMPRVNNGAEAYERTANAELIIRAADIQEAAFDMLHHPYSEEAREKLKKVLE